MTQDVSKPPGPRRYLALWAPFLPTDRLRKLFPSAAPADAPLVVVEKIGGALRLCAVDPHALRLGLGPGLTLADARARVPFLAVTDADDHADTLCLERLADFCDRWTPLVALDPPHGLLLDISGCAHLFGGEERLIADIRRRFTSSGLALRLAIAGTPDAARAVARHGDGGIIAPGADEAAVAPLPIGALRVDQSIVHALSRAGLKTIGALTERPSTALAARFGDDLTLRLACTIGRIDLRITPRRAPPACMAERPFAEPIARADDIEGTLASLMRQTADLLRKRGEGGRRFEAFFFRADGAVTRITVETGHPEREAAVLIRLYREKLDALADPLDPGFGFDLIRFCVPVAEPLDPAQTSLDGRAEAQADVETLIDRLTARFGRERVQRFAWRDTHDPARRAYGIPAAGSSALAAAAIEVGEPALRPLHMFDPPQPISMVTAEFPDGPPVRFEWRRAAHRIVLAEGPERIAPEWWRRGVDAPTRDYYRVEDAEGRRFWVFRSGLYAGEDNIPRWFVHGLFA